jgi:pathogenesis-related protein 1
LLLVWSDKLAADAKTWAEHLATLGEINQQNAHDPNRNGEGENVHLGNPAYRAITSVEEMLQGWVSEKNNYHGEPTGQALHYTQMVWNTTKEVGCATASDGKRDILDCRYSPPGNVIGQKPY